MPTELLNLRELGRRLGMVDEHLVALLAQRMDLAKQVEAYKREHEEALIRLAIEDQRIESVKTLAKTKGLNPNFIAAFQYMIMAEACRVEIFQMQNEPEIKARELSPEQLKENLLALTKEIAPLYDQNYGSAFFATRSYLTFEGSVIKREVGTLKALGMSDLAVDLGCATGKVSFKLAESFQRVVGYDISPAMITEAKKNLQKAGSPGNIEFKVADIEEGIPEESNSVSLVVMSLGTASDVFDLRRVLVSIRRILKPDGKVLFSCYNSGALLYRCWFIPWPVSLAASMNRVKRCLDVRLKDKTFSIYARSYSVSEAKRLLLQNGFLVSSVSTYPTISAILPNEFFKAAEGAQAESAEAKSARADAERMQSLISAIDHRLADLESGAYTLITTRKGT